MAAFTSKATGNWSASGQTTWTQVGVPANGDTVTIQDTHVITVDVNTTVGSSPATGGTAAIAVTGTTGSLVIPASVTLTARGDITLNNAVMTMNAGATLTFDASAAGAPSTTTYKVLIGTAGYQHTAALNINGSSGSRCAVQSNASGGNGYITNTADSGSLLATYCDFTRIGDATNPAVSANSHGDAGMDLQHCVFTSCGSITATGQPGATIINRLLGVTMKSTVASNSLLNWNGGTTALTSGTRLIQDCVFDVTSTLAHVTSLTITNTLFTNLVIANDNATAGWVSFTNVFLRRTDQGSVADLFGGDVSNCYFLGDLSVANEHYIGAGSANRNQRITGCIWELNDTHVDGDGILIDQPGSPTTLTIDHCLKLPNSAGTSSGTMISAIGNANITLVLNHNTMHMGGGVDSSGLRVGETYNAHTGMITSCRNNLAWDTVAQGFVLLDNNGAPNTDVVTAANCDYNGKYNVSGTGYSGLVFSSGSPGAHDVTGNPTFVDSARNLAKWDLSLGGAGTVANALTELGKLNDAGYNSAYTIAALLTYVKAGFKPTNAAFNAANDNVAPSNGWMGAVDGSTGTPVQSGQYMTTF